MCTAQMDKLAQNAYKTNSNYLYRGKTKVPPLEMGDDVLVPVKFSQESIIANVKVNSFIESKNLKLNVTKNQKMHIGKVNKNCPDLKVHENKMETSSEEKYLGDILTDDAKIQKKILITGYLKVLGFHLKFLQFCRKSL